MISNANINRIVRSLIAEEWAHEHGRALPLPDVFAWTDDTRVDDERIGFDSLGLLGAVARVNQFFHLHEIGSEDYLLTQRTLGAWTDIVAQSLAMRHERVTVLTSGSTGDPKPCTHKRADLDQEISVHADLLASARRIIALVPPHHIYGLLWTALLPETLGVEVVDARLWGPGRIARETGPTDLIVLTPFVAAYLLKSGAQFAGEPVVVSSTAPLPARDWDAMLAAGVGKIWEIYGSSETGGVGLRSTPNGAFELLHYWARGHDDRLARTRDGDVSDHDAPDLLDWSSARAFTPSRRKDGAVQVGGVNVFPERVRAVILDHPDVQDCAVRTTGHGGDARLTAFLVAPQTGALGFDSRALIERVDAHCRARLTAVERPKSFQVGAALPRTAMGKLAGWREDA